MEDIIKLGQETGKEAADRLIISLKRSNPAGIALELWEMHELGCMPPYNPGPPGSIRRAGSEVRLNYGKGFDIGFMKVLKEQLKTDIPEDIESARREYLLKKYGVKFKNNKPVEEGVLCRS